MNLNRLNQAIDSLQARYARRYHNRQQLRWDRNIEVIDLEAEEIVPPYQNEIAYSEYENSSSQEFEYPSEEYENSSSEEEESSSPLPTPPQRLPQPEGWEWSSSDVLRGNTVVNRGQVDSQSQSWLQGCGEVLDQESSLYLGNQSEAINCIQRYEVEQEMMDQEDNLESPMPEFLQVNKNKSVCGVVPQVVRQLEICGALNEQERRQAIRDFTTYIQLYKGSIVITFHLRTGVNGRLLAHPIYMTIERFGAYETGAFYDIISSQYCYSMEFCAGGDFKPRFGLWETGRVFQRNQSVLYLDDHTAKGHHFFLEENFLIQEILLEINSRELRIWKH